MLQYVRTYYNSLYRTIAHYYDDDGDDDDDDDDDVFMSL